MSIPYKLVAILAGAAASGFAAKQIVLFSIKDKALAKSLAWPLGVVAFVGALLAFADLAEKYCKWHIFQMYCDGVVSAPTENTAATPVTTRAPAAILPGSSLKDCLTCPTMVVIPVGRFRMGNSIGHAGPGSEAPVREVSIGVPIAVGKYEVTFEEWDACVAENVCSTAGDNGWGRGDQPVINVTWFDAQTFVSYLTLKTKKKYRLLSESEWEYMARAGGENYFDGLGTQQGDLNCKIANISESISGGIGCTGKAVSTGSYPPNKFGVHDAAGNVWEWVQDCFRANYRDAPVDGSAAAEFPNCRRVFRGGAWNVHTRHGHFYTRMHNAPDDKSPNLGFRVARDL